MKVFISTITSLVNLKIVIHINLGSASPIFKPPGISRLLDEIETKFPRQPHIFHDGHSNGTIGETIRCDRKWKIQDGGF